MHINFKVLDINVDHDLLILDMLIPVTKPIQFGVCYRPPSQKDFYKGLEFVLNNYNALTKECIIMGDFNMDTRKRIGDNYNALQSLCKLFHFT